PSVRRSHPSTNGRYREGACGRRVESGAMTFARTTTRHIQAAGGFDTATAYTSSEALPRRNNELWGPRTRGEVIRGRCAPLSPRADRGAFHREDPRRHPASPASESRDHVSRDRNSRRRNLPSSSPTGPV